MSDSARTIEAFFHAMRAKKGRCVFSDEELAELRVILDRQKALEESADRHDYERENE